MKAFRVTVVCSAVAGLVFFLCTALAYDIRTGLFSAVLGMGIGVVGAPVVEPRAFRHALLQQVLGGAVGGVAVACFATLDPLGLLLGATVGAVLGFFADSWVKHVPLP